VVVGDGRETSKLISYVEHPSLGSHDYKTPNGILEEALSSGSHPSSSCGYDDSSLINLAHPLRLG
jgi:hypothetical protein